MRRLAAFLPTLLLSLPLHGEDDLSYAETLAGQGYFDLAREVCERIRTDPTAPAEQKEALDLALATIVRREAGASREPAEVRDAALDSAAKSARRFLSEHAAHPRVPDARLLLGEIERDRGLLWADAARAQADPARRLDQAARADARFKSAEELFQGLASDLKAAGAPKENAAFLRASYDLPLVRYDRANAMGPGKARDDLLSAAVQGMDEFRWAFDGFAAAYDLAITEGLAAADLGRLDKAVEVLDVAIGLKDAEAIDETTRPLIFRAYWVKARVLAAVSEAEAGKKWWPMALEACDQAEALAASANDLVRDKVIPDGAFFQDGESSGYRMRALVEKARALSKMGEQAAALAAAQKAAASKGPWQVEARELLAEFAGTAGGDVPLPSRIVLIEGCLRREDWTGAVEQARLALAACKEPQDARRHGVTVRLRMGTALQQLERFKEAAQAFEEAGRVLEVLGDPSPEEKERAAECAYRAASCWGKQSAASGDPLDDGAYERAVKLLVDRFGDSAYAANAAFIVAERIERQGNWAEAAAQYGRVAEGAQAYDQALLRIGYCRYQVARQLWADAAKDPARKDALAIQAREAFARAEEGLRACLERSRKGSAEPEAAAGRVRAANDASFVLASILMHEAVNRHAEAVPLLDEVERANADRPEVLGKAKAFRVDALVRIAGTDPSGLAKAEEALDELIASLPDSPRVEAALQLVGAALDRAAAAADPATRPALARRAADRLRAWVERAMHDGRKVRSTDALVVVDRLLAQGTEEDLGGALAIARVWERFEGIPPEGEDVFLTRVARAQVRLGRHAEAKEALERLHEARPGDFEVLYDLAEAYLGLGRGGETSYSDRALELLTDLVSRSEVDSEPYWRGWWRLLETLFETGRYAAADAQMLSLEMRNPKFDGGRFGLAEKFRELKVRIGEKVKR
ncbi:MAG: tetratricopeptide repeat protein [Planctomycetota bacterium]